MTAVLSVLVIALAVAVIVNYLVADYGRARGFAFWPLFITAFFLGWPLVWLAVAIGAGVRAKPAVPDWDDESEPEVALWQR
jgi:hypothetical protein